MHLAVGQGVAPPPLRVEVRRVVRDVGQRVVDLVVEAVRILVRRGSRSVIRARFAERHLPVAVEAAGRVDRDRQRADVAALAPAVAEEVAERAPRPTASPRRPSSSAGRRAARLLGWTVSQMCWIAPGPSISASTVLSRPATIDAAARPSSPGPARARLRRRCPSVAMPAAPFSPVGILRADRAGARVGEQRQRAEQGAHGATSRSPSQRCSASTKPGPWIISAAAWSARTAASRSSPEASATARRR